MKLAKLGVIVFCSALAVGLGTACGNAGTAKTAAGGAGAEGKKLFEKHCAVCHKDGGNIMNAKKTLKKADMKANGVKGVDGIVKLMRNPGPGMSKFDKKAITDEQAKAIANYIISTY